jgi:dUTP pyrophosphatase
MIVIANLGDSDFVLNDGDRIAQLVIAPVVHAVFEETLEISYSLRSAGGFGSTGV